MSYIYRIFAELTWIVHGLIFFSWLSFGLFWQELFWYYIIAYPVGASSWIVYKRCILTDFENWLRIKAWQEILEIKESFLWYWWVKIFGKNIVSNTTIRYIIYWFYICVTPIWIYTLYLVYISSKL